MRNGLANMDDVALWKLFIRGEEEALGEVYRRFYPLLKSYGKRMTHDEELVRDVIQELFVKLIQNCRHLHPTNNVRFYLLCAFRHKLMDAFASMRQTENVEDCSDYFSFEPEDANRLFEKDDDALSCEKKLGQAIARLSGRQREILYLYYVKELPHREIASLLSINVQSSKNLLFRTICRIKEWVL